MSISNKFPLTIFAVACALLVIEAQILGTATAWTRGKVMQKHINKEDSVWLGGEHVSVDDERVQRIFRAHRNDLENLLPFFIGGMLCLLCNVSPMAATLYFIIFVLARYAHTFAYLTARARLRRDAYATGWLVTLVMSVHAAGSALAASMH